MSDIIDQNEIFKKYDYSSVITQQDVDYVIKDIKSIIDAGNYWENSPKFQTKENVFARQHPSWMKFRMSFLFSVFLPMHIRLYALYVLSFCVYVHM